VPPRDPAALAAALRRLADEPDLRDRLRAAAGATPGLLTDADVAAAHARFYAEVVRRREEGAGRRRTPLRRE
jgi:glycosyltransferase involved in cell wall biosynthesis